MNPGGNRRPALSVRRLVKEFPVGGLLSRGHVRAVGGVDLDLHEGEILALVGESGSGKSTIARCLARLERPTSGEILLDGENVLATQRRHASRDYRSQVQMVFQDPFGSLNPAHRVSHFLERALLLHPGKGTTDDGDLASRTASLLAQVELPASMLHSYPHELSGGQRQRVAIARALAVQPRVILADEPTSMLDVSVRIGILNLMRRLQSERGISILYITHDLAAARYVADRTAVMFAGEIVEVGESLELMAQPAHPYTQLLLSAVPDPARSGSFDAAERAALRAQVLGATSCPFDDGDGGGGTGVRHQLGADHWVRCHLHRPHGEAARRSLDTAVAGTSIASTTEAGAA